LAFDFSLVDFFEHILVKSVVSFETRAFRRKIQRQAFLDSKVHRRSGKRTYSIIFNKRSSDYAVFCVFSDYLFFLTTCFVVDFNEFDLEHSLLLFFRLLYEQWQIFPSSEIRFSFSSSSDFSAILKDLFSSLISQNFNLRLRLFAADSIVSSRFLCYPFSGLLVSADELLHIP